MIAMASLRSRSSEESRPTSEGSRDLRLAARSLTWPASAASKVTVMSNL